MAATDFEAALVTMIIDTKDIRTVIKNKITSDFLADPICRAAFIFLVQWYQNPKYGDTPSWESFNDNFEGFEINRVDDSIEALCDGLRRQKVFADIAGLLTEVGELTAGDPMHGFEALKKKVVWLTAAHTVDNTSTVNSSIAQIKAEYLAMKSGSTGGLKGYPYPWDALNQATLGLQNQQLVFLYGRPKSGKSWLLLEIARVLYETGLRLLIFTQEMSDIEIKRRFVALACSVDYDKFLRGTLPPDVESDFLDNLDAFVEREDIPISQLTADGEGCLTELTAKIDEYKPNVVFIDGVNYLSSDWKELAEINRGLKRICQSKDIPIIASTHANRSRKGKSADVHDNADDFAYGDSFYQTTDLALRITSDIEDKKARQVKIFTSAIREGKSTLFTVNTYFAQNLTQKGVEQFGDAENDIESEIDQDALDTQSDLPEETTVEQILTTPIGKLSNLLKRN